MCDSHKHTPIIAYHIHRAVTIDVPLKFVRHTFDDTLRFRSKYIYLH